MEETPLVEDLIVGVEREAPTLGDRRGENKMKIVFGRLGRLVSRRPSELILFRAGPIIPPAGGTSGTIATSSCRPTSGS